MSLYKHPVIEDGADCWPSGFGALRQAVLLQASGLLPTKNSERTRLALTLADARVTRLNRRGGRFAQVRTSARIDAVRAALEASRIGLAVAKDGTRRLATYSLSQAG
jgi:hypothetical protein